MISQASLTLVSKGNQTKTNRRRTTKNRGRSEALEELLKQLDEKKQLSAKSCKTKPRKKSVLD